MKVLLVDDAEDIRLLIGSALRARGWDVVTAGDGREACAVLEQSDIRIVITDWMMPVMDGLELIEWIRARSAHEYVYTILMTSRDQDVDRIEGLSVGADDYLDKPTPPAVLHARLGVARRILDMQQELLDQAEQLRQSRDLVTRAYATVKSDLEGASVVQRSLLPVNGSSTGAVETSFFYREAMGLSGDSLDIVALGPHRMAFYLLDVSGHGVTAALRAAAISQLLRPVSGLLDDLETQGPAAVLTRLNRHLCESSPDADYLVTMVFCDLDARTGRLRLASAGHPPALWLSERRPAKPVTGDGIPMGVDPGAEFQNEVIVLAQGDTMLLYSDGLPECESPHGVPFGIERLGLAADSVTGGAPSALLAHIETGLERWRDGAEAADDLSALAVRFAPDAVAPGAKQGAWT